MSFLTPTSFFNFLFVNSITAQCSTPRVPLGQKSEGENNGRKNVEVGKGGGQGSGIWGSRGAVLVIGKMETRREEEREKEMEGGESRE
jgi:hypothetical protein